MLDDFKTPLGLIIFGSSKYCVGESDIINNLRCLRNNWQCFYMGYEYLFVARKESFSTKFLKRAILWFELVEKSIV